MKYLIPACILFVFISCKTKIKSTLSTEITIADTLELPKDSLQFYFPKNSFSEKPGLDSFIQNWYSSSLYNLKEPVLSGNYIGHDIYRFLWLRSFHRPAVFTLHHTKEQIWLCTKMLDKQPRFHDDIIGGILSKKDREDLIKDGYSVYKDDPDYLFKKADREASIVYYNNTSLSKEEWDQFEELLVKANFWNLPSIIDDESTDGAQWIIEAHFDKKYHFVDYHSPEDAYKELGVFLIKLSGLKEEIY